MTLPLKKLLSEEVSELYENDLNSVLYSVIYMYHAIRQKLAKQIGS